MIAFKFFGEAGEARAWQWIDEARLPEGFHALLRSSYLSIRDRIERTTDVSDVYFPEMVRIVGLNLYHELRPV